MDSYPLTSVSTGHGRDVARIRTRGNARTRSTAWRGTAGWQQRTRAPSARRTGTIRRRRSRARPPRSRRSSPQFPHTRRTATRSPGPGRTCAAGGHRRRRVRHCSLPLPPLRLFVVQYSLEGLQALLQPLRKHPQVLEHAFVASRDLARLLPSRDEVQNDEQRRRYRDEDDERDADEFAHSGGSDRVGAAGHLPAKLLELARDRLVGFQGGELVLQVLRQAQVVRLHAAFHVVDAPRVLLEAHQRVVDLVVVDAAPRGEPAVRRLVAREQRLLPRLRVTQLALEPRDVVVQLGQALVDGLVIRLHGLGRRRGTLLLDQRRLREIVPALADRELGLRLPVPLLALQRLELAVQVLLVGNRPRRGRPHLDQRVLHLLDHEADDLLRVLGLVQDRVDVGVHDVAESREYAHGLSSRVIWVRVAPDFAGCVPARRIAANN